MRLPRSKTHVHLVVPEDDTATAFDQHASDVANGALGRNTFAVLENHNTNTDPSTPAFIESLTTKLKELHIYSPKKNRNHSHLPIQHSLTQSYTDPKILSVLTTVREEAENCDNCTSATAPEQGPFPASSPRVTVQDEGGPSLAETLASTSAATRQAPDAFEGSFPSKALRTAVLQQCSLDTDPHIRSAIARLKTGQYDYVLSVPASEGSATRRDSHRRLDGPTLNYGCTVLAQKNFIHAKCSRGNPANSYQILATYLTPEDLVHDSLYSPTQEQDEMAVAEPVVRLVASTPAGENTALNKADQTSVTVAVLEQAHDREKSDSGVPLTSSRSTSDRVISVSTDVDSVRDPLTPSRTSSTSSQSRIEDSVEALDRLEEQLEAIDIDVRQVTPSKARRAQMAIDEPSSMECSGRPTRPRQPNGSPAKPTTSQARSARMKPISVTQAGRNKSTDPGNATPSKALDRRSNLTRPSSLASPKAPAKSDKPLTKPTFELPGVAVARRLKEQREARLAQKLQENATVAAMPQRTRSTKAPTRPNFELPGAAISARKKEEREARLRLQEEEERRRREFKARPIRANLGSAPPPRETVTSRARQGKGFEPDASQLQSSSKRSSTLGVPRATLTRTASVRSPQARGRGASQSTASPQASRATSTSTGSMSGKHSTISSEELEQQKIKGREVFERDNSYLEDKERLRRERELNAKFAREQAAERSRQAGREWAEKQRRKQLATAAAVTRQAV